MVDELLEGGAIEVEASGGELWRDPYPVGHVVGESVDFAELLRVDKASETFSITDDGAGIRFAYAGDASEIGRIGTIGVEVHALCELLRARTAYAVVARLPFGTSCGAFGFFGVPACAIGLVFLFAAFACQSAFLLLALPFVPLCLSSLHFVERIDAPTLFEIAYFA